MSRVYGGFVMMDDDIPNVWVQLERHYEINTSDVQK
jgi:hypothetical protein